MKLHARITASAAFFMVSVVVVLVYYSKNKIDGAIISPITIQYRKAMGLLPQRIIIFGDENSGILPYDHPLRGSSTAPTSVWTEILCSTLWADCDSFAPPKTLPTDPKGSDVFGAAVDNLVFNSSSDAPDFRTQVEEWIDFEKKARSDGIPVERSSMFMVFFGMNDIWRYSGWEWNDASAAVEASLDSLFEQLGVLDGNWEDVVQVLVPTVMDVTLLPGWHKYRLKRDPTGEQQRNAIKLIKKWNQGLQTRALKWAQGHIMIWDANKWFVDSIRKGKQAGWESVREPCVNSSGTEAEEETCKKPEKYLMWDDVHIGPQAHAQMAQEVMEYLL
ncbi:hypothetical protein RUND412_004681 [Rhizina undulata]